MGGGGCSVRGFSLPELLVVIGIIVVLIGLLLPVVRRVRLAAMRADTLNAIRNLSDGVYRYYQDFQAFPGPIHNDVIGSQPSLGGTLLRDSGGAAVAPTGTENLTLALAGGLLYTGGATPAFTFQRSLVGSGPLSLNAANPRQYPAYATVPAADYSAGRIAAGDSVIPEFRDRYSDPMPILYLRARVGATGIAGGAATDQYNPAHLSAYGFTAAGSDFPGGFTQYFSDPNNHAQARQKDAFLLIGAGTDRQWGTLDDLLSAGSFQ